MLLHVSSTSIEFLSKSTITLYFIVLTPSLDKRRYQITENVDHTKFENAHVKYVLENALSSILLREVLGELCREQQPTNHVERHKVHWTG